GDRRALEKRAAGRVSQAPGKASAENGGVIGHELGKSFTKKDALRLRSAQAPVTEHLVISKFPTRGAHRSTVPGGARRDRQPASLRAERSVLFPIRSPRTGRSSDRSPGSSLTPDLRDMISHLYPKRSGLAAQVFSANMRPATSLFCSFDCG